MSHFITGTRGYTVPTGRQSNCHSSTNYIQNNFYGSGSGNIFNYGNRGGCCSGGGFDYGFGGGYDYGGGYGGNSCNGGGSNKMFGWMLGLSMGTGILGGLFSAFGKSPDAEA